MNNVAVLTDVAKKNNITVRVRGKNNLKMCMGDLCAYITIRELYELLLVITDEEQRANILPVRRKELMKFVRQHSVKLKNDMKAGEMMVVNCEVNVPKIVVDNIVNKEKGQTK
jgi:hypothetical protein